jgi:uncharacterized cupin superfamily protein
MMGLWQATGGLFREELSPWEPPNILTGRTGW